jgi:N4-gp56 family major capsid protein
MATTIYGDISARTAAYAEKELLKRGLPYLVIEKFGQAKPLPDHSSKVIKFRRYSALPTTPASLTEGVTPVGQTLAATDVTAQLTQYGDKITVTDVIMDTHEDPVLNEAMALLGEQAAQMIEKMRFGILKAGTSVQFANGGMRTAVNSPISLTVQRRCTRALKRQNGRAITNVVRSTPAFGTEAVAPSFIGLVHPDCESDVRNLVGFVPVEKYGSMTPYENEIGKCEDVRYLSSTVFEPWANASSAALNGMLSTGGTLPDVYPCLYIARDSYATVALKGMFAVTPMVVNASPSDSDPLAQRSTVGWKSMQTCVILNDSWMVRAEICATA